MFKVPLSHQAAVYLLCMCCPLIRYAKYNTVNGVEERTLYKAFGIRFDVMVFGQVGLFVLPHFYSL